MWSMLIISTYNILSSSFFSLHNVLYAYLVGPVSTLTPSNTRVREWKLHISTALVGAGGACSMCAFKTMASLLCLNS